MVSNDSAVSASGVGLGMAAVAGMMSRNKALMPRPKAQQVLLTAAAMGLGYVAGSWTEKLNARIDDALPGGDQVARAAMLAASTATVAGLTMSGRATSKRLGTVASAATVLAAGSATGLALAATKPGGERLDSMLPGGDGAARTALIVGGGVAAGAALAHRYGGFSRVFPALEPHPVPAPRLTWQWYDNLPYKAWDNDKLLPTVAGMDSVQGKLKGIAGRYFLDGATPGTTLARVMQEDAVDPIRVYAGLGKGDDFAERADMVMDHLEELGAFEPGKLHNITLYSATGTGFVNPIATEAIEAMSRGRTAGVSIQYGTMPSALSLHKIGKGTDAQQQILDRVSARLAQMPEAQRPKLFLYGESLGGITSQGMMNKRGPAALTDKGVDAAVWPGPPGFGKARKEIFGEEPADFLARERTVTVTDETTGVPYTIIETKGGEDFANLTRAERDPIRMAFISHPEDSVVRAGIKHFWRKPTWLGPDRAAEIGPDPKYIPGVSGLMGLVDGKNGATVVPGVFARIGHDYRLDLPHVIKELYGFEDTVSTQQMDRIFDMLEQNEINRAIVRKRAPSAGAKLPDGSVIGQNGVEWNDATRAKFDWANWD